MNIKMKEYKNEMLMSFDDYFDHNVSEEDKIIVQSEAKIISDQIKKDSKQDK